MNARHRSTLTRLALAALGLCAATSLGAAPKSAKPAAAAPLRIELFSELPAAHTPALVALLERFNAQEKSGRIELLDSATAGQATLSILGPRAEEALLAKPASIKPLWSVMKAAGLPLQVTNAAAGLAPPLLSEAGGLRALPVALETPVLFANADLLAKAGLDATQLPRTWPEMQEQAGKLADAHVACPLTTVRPATVLLENQSALHNTPFASTDGARLAANGLGQVRHLARMASWQKSRYLVIHGHEDEAVAAFAKGQCGFLLAGQAAMVHLRAAALNFTVGPTPYYADVPGAPWHSLADGAAMWVAAGRSAAEYKLVARFVQFWLEPTQQIEWQRQAGYLPLNRAGSFAASSQLLGDELKPIAVAVKQLLAKPVTAQSRASNVGRSARVRAMLNEQMDAVWNEGVAAKLALDTAVSRAPVAAPCGKQCAK